MWTRQSSGHQGPGLLFTWEGHARARSLRLRAYTAPELLLRPGLCPRNPAKLKGGITVEPQPHVRDSGHRAALVLGGPWMTPPKGSKGPGDSSVTTLTLVPRGLGV